MKLAATTLAAALGWSACSAVGPDALPTAAASRELILRAGESANTEAAGLRVGFVGVSSDSRCPKGERCVWAGDAVVQVWLQRGAEPRESLELHVAPGDGQAAQALGHELRLVRLDPYPVSGRPIAQRDYVATLMLVRSTKPGNQGTVSR